MSEVNPALPFEEIQIDGTTYKMVFTHAALAQAEATLQQKGFQVNLLLAILNRHSYNSVRTLFACSLVTYQPELNPAETQNWVNEENLAQVMLAIDAAWKKSKPEPTKANPPAPGA